MRCASTMSWVESSFHIGLFAGTQRIVAACPQKRIPAHSGRTSCDISVRSKYPIPSSASATSATRRRLYRLLRSSGLARSAVLTDVLVVDIGILSYGCIGYCLQHALVARQGVLRKNVR